MLLDFAFLRVILAPGLFDPVFQFVIDDGFAGDNDYHLIQEWSISRMRSTVNELGKCNSLESQIRFYFKHIKDRFENCFENLVLDIFTSLGHRVRGYSEPCGDEFEIKSPNSFVYSTKHFCQRDPVYSCLRIWEKTNPSQYQNVVCKKGDTGQITTIADVYYTAMRDQKMKLCKDRTEILISEEVSSFRIGNQDIEATTNPAINPVLWTKPTSTWNPPKNTLEGVGRLWTDLRGDWAVHLGWQQRCGKGVVNIINFEDAISMQQDCDYASQWQDLSKKLCLDDGTRKKYVHIIQLKERDSTWVPPGFIKISHVQRFESDGGYFLEAEKFIKAFVMSWVFDLTNFDCQGWQQKFDELHTKPFQSEKKGLWLLLLKYMTEMNRIDFDMKNWRQIIDVQQWIGSPLIAHAVESLERNHVGLDFFADDHMATWGSPANPVLDENIGIWFRLAICWSERQLFCNAWLRWQDFGRRLRPNIANISDIDMDGRGSSPIADFNLDVSVIHIDLDDLTSNASELQLLVNDPEDANLMSIGSSNDRNVDDWKSIKSLNSHDELESSPGFSAV